MRKATPYQIENQSYDIVVVGGGLAGVCAAVTAAQTGANVALIHNRPVLGGPSSSEIGVLPTGAEFGRYRYARETGLIEQLRMKERYQSPNSSFMIGQMDSSWDILLWETVMQAGVALFLNCIVYQVNVENHRITGVMGMQSGSERRFCFQAKQYIDTSGDGTLAALAGAPFRFGRESKEEYGESLAQDQADNKTLCSSLLFRVKEHDYKVPFKAPAWAYDYPTEEDLPFRDHNYVKSGYWWIEDGGCADTIRDNETIRNELLKMLYGVWDHIKNHGEHGADHLSLEWISAIPGKRESRRIVGEYTLKQKDLYESTAFEDAVAYGGWYIDFHLSEGLRSPSPPADNYYINKVYPIPLRCLYTPQIGNLMMAGRDASFSHVALMSARVMPTCAVMGEAVGVTAGLCIQKDKDPSLAAQEDIREIQQILLRRDCYIPGVVNTDQRDAARKATVQATSHSPLSVPHATSWMPVKVRLSQVIAVSGKQLDTISLRFKNTASSECEACLRVYSARDFWDFNGDLIGETVSKVAGNDTGMTSFAANLSIEGQSLVRLELCETEDLLIGVNDHEIIGTQAAVFNENYPDKELEGRGIYNYFLQWKYIPGSLCFTTKPTLYPYAPHNVVNGVGRPDKAANLWISDPAQDMPQALTLTLEQPQSISSVELVFDTDLSQCIWQIPMPCAHCVRDYTVEIHAASEWKTVADEKGNFMRKRIHRFQETTADQVRITITATNGSQTAHVYEVRIY